MECLEPQSYGEFIVLQYCHVLVNIDETKYSSKITDTKKCVGTKTR